MTTNDKQPGAGEDSEGRYGAESGERRIIGPPGTGKTTKLSEDVKDAVARFGPEAVLVTSFSRAAAAEFAGHHLPVGPRKQKLATLHAVTPQENCITDKAGVPGY